jgi:hypothetical protein
MSDSSPFSSPVVMIEGRAVIQRRNITRRILISVTEGTGVYNTEWCRIAFCLVARRNGAERVIVFVIRN